MKPTTNKPHCHIHDEVKSWHNVDDIHEKVCTNDLPLTKHINNKYYCLFHLPRNDKNTTEFNHAFNKRIAQVDAQIEKIKKLSKENQQVKKDTIRYDFRYLWFPDEFSFTHKKFSANVTFSSATFSANAYFSATKFMGEADYSSTTFAKDVYFSWAKFEDENTKIYFYDTKFLGRVDFYNTTFKGYIKFIGEKNNSVFIGENSLLSLQEAIIEDVKRFSFDAIRLQPTWFIKTDARKYWFHDCKWEYSNGNPITARGEVTSLNKFDDVFNDSNELLTITCRQLASNAEDNNDYYHASLFREIAMESKRLKRYGRVNIFSLHWWYWLSSFYGERWKRALWVLLAVLFIFAMGFMQSPFYICPPNIPISQSSQNNLCETRKLNISEALRHSLASATLQNVEYRKPVTERSETLVLLEKIFAPLQAALLALAIRRKFMR
jgi:hypothetical protein